VVALFSRNVEAAAYPADLEHLAASEHLTHGPSCLMRLAFCLRAIGSMVKVTLSEVASFSMTRAQTTISCIVQQ
jgi:hypothetical protein